jgi:glycerol-3-phosphate dehydrogenase (NAD(P)+)
MSELAVLGAGAWGRALAVQAARAGAGVTLWGRAPVARASPRLPGIVLPDTVRLASEPPARADAILVCVPMQQLRAALCRLLPAAPLLLCCKGLEAGTFLLPLEVAASVHPGVPAAVLTGPNFAGEVAAGLPAAAVVACADAALRARLVGLLGSPTFRLYGGADPVGAQLGGAAKNVVAIAAGAVIGAGYGENARAALVTRALAELARLMAAQGGRAETAAGLSGLGDLVLTCTGPASRNFSYGMALATGRPAADRGVVEGVATAPALVARAAGVELPICAAVADLLAGALTLEGAMARLLSRKVGEES